MRKLALGNPGGDTIQWLVQSMHKINRASHEDIDVIFDQVALGGESFIETRTLDPETATVGDIANFLATLVSDIQRRGQ